MEISGVPAFPKILCVIPALTDDLREDTLRSVLNQTVPPAKVMVLSKKVGGNLTFPARMSKVLNDGLESVDLRRFDYLLRVDGDTVLSLDFVEKNLLEKPHVMGYGDAMLIHVPTFLKVMNGRFFWAQDDSYIRFKFACEGYRSVDCKVKPLVQREHGKTHSVRYFVERGMLMYQFGYEPVHVFSKFLLNARNAFMVVGYVEALLRRYPKFDVAGYVAWYQVNHFIHPSRLVQKLKKYLRSFTFR